MLLINKTLIRLAKGLWGWVLAIAGLRFLSLFAITAFAGQISDFIGNIYSPDMTLQDARGAILAALTTSLLMLAFELLRGEAEYRCTARARVLLRDRIFSKVVELDAGRIEKLGPVSAITASVDAVEQMQVYYSQYLPGLIYCILSPFYLYFRLRTVSPAVAAFMGATAFVLLPLNNIFRKAINERKTGYWGSFEGLTAYYLESIHGLNTIKLFGREEDRTATLREKAFDLNNWIMSYMRVNFSSFLMTEGMINAAIVGGILIGARQLMTGKIGFDSALLLIMLGYSFFNAFRELLSATHSAITGVAAVDKVEKVLSIDTSRPYDPGAPKDPKAFSGIRLEHVSHTYEGRNVTLQDVSLEVPKGSTIAIAGLSGCGKSTAAGLMMKFFDPASGKIYIDGNDYVSLTPEELRKKVIMVPQSVSIFSGTIADNLLVAAPGSGPMEMKDALSEVGLSDWVIAQPDGL
ncbi:MAG: ATP-binding cassette domain-containing protein, partial [Firmicutes bacterium]|nr:ATP-binding cassette domain-containing protein [Bacillota bacterium]